MSSIEGANSAMGGEADRQAYDPSLLKILSEPSRPAPAPPAPGLRKVVVPVLSLRSAAPSAAEGPAGEYEITLDISQQVLNLDVPVDEGYGHYEGSIEAPLYPSFTDANRSENFTPAAALALKAKQFDDGLYAAVEMAADAVRALRRGAAVHPAVLIADRRGDGQAVQPLGLIVARQLEADDV